MADRDRPRPRLLLVTGMSGAGKSTVLDALEDMGWDCVDNLPANLLRQYVDGELSAEQKMPMAIGMDVRSRGFDPGQLSDLLASIDGITPEILYLDCAGSELVRRYDETRRRHPLAPDRPAEDGIAKERAATAPLRQVADTVIDTTELKPAELREELLRRYGGEVEEPVITIVSFGFARGISRTADLVFDMRFADNPYWVDTLRPLTGEDEAVRDYCSRDVSWMPVLEQIETLLIGLIPRYWAAGKSYLTIAFGCTGGRHRSVAAAVEIASRLRSAGFSPNVRHRDLATPPSERIEDNPRIQGRGPSDDAGE